MCSITEGVKNTFFVSYHLYLTILLHYFYRLTNLYFTDVLSSLTIHIVLFLPLFPWLLFLLWIYWLHVYQPHSHSPDVLDFLFIYSHQISSQSRQTLTSIFTLIFLSWVSSGTLSLTHFIFSPHTHMIKREKYWVRRWWRWIYPAGERENERRERLWLLWRRFVFSKQLCFSFLISSKGS